MVSILRRYYSLRFLIVNFQKNIKYNFFKESDLTIIVGSNQPIILEFDENIDSITKLSCALFRGEEECMSWDLNTVIIDEDNKTIKLPISEEQSFNLIPTQYELEVKWLEDGNIEFAQIMNINVVKRRDQTRLEEDL